MIFNKRYFKKGSNDGGPKVEVVGHVESLWSLLNHIYAFAMLDYIPRLKVLDLNGHEKMVSEAMSRAGRRPGLEGSIEVQTKTTSKEGRIIGRGGGESTKNELCFILFSTRRRGCMSIQLGTSMNVNVMLLSRLFQGFSWSCPPIMEEIDLSESINDLSMAKPLHARAKPCLTPKLYPA